MDQEKIIANTTSTHKIRTVADEIEDTLRINKEMLEKEGIIYLLETQNFRIIEFDHALFADNGVCGENLRKLYIEKIYPLVSSPQYRAEQHLIYQQLPIFQGLMPLIDEALDNFFSGNFISSYMTLVPLIEGLLLRWADRKKDTSKFDFRAFIKKKVPVLQAKFPDSKWVEHNANLLQHIICGFFFKESEKADMETMFNRNIASHLLNDPDYVSSAKNTLRLLTIVDLIAECYSYELDFEYVSVTTQWGGYTGLKYKEDGKNIITLNTQKYNMLQALSISKKRILKELTNSQEPIKI